MSLNAATIEFLLEKGLTGADLLEVARRSESRRDTTNAERQARHRAKRSGKSNGVTVTPVTPPNDISILNPPITPVISDEMTSPAVESETEPEKVTAEHVMEAYNGLADRLGLPKAEKLTKNRRRQAEARIRENPIENWRRAFDAIERSAFLRGENDRGWRADFDFLIQSKSFIKLIEGAYDH